MGRMPAKVPVADGSRQVSSRTSQQHQALPHRRPTLSPAVCTVKWRQMGGGGRQNDNKLKHTPWPLPHPADRPRAGNAAASLAPPMLSEIHCTVNACSSTTHGVLQLTCLRCRSAPPWGRLQVSDEACRERPHRPGACRTCRRLQRRTRSAEIIKREGGQRHDRVPANSQPAVLVWVAEAPATHCALACLLWQGLCCAALVRRHQEATPPLHCWFAASFTHRRS